MRHKCKKSGFTLVEILTVMGIIALLAGILITSGAFVHGVVKNVRQKSQLISIEQGLLSFRGDYGDYPPSGFPRPNVRVDYCGAQMLAEALLGWDLLGFHPNSAWKSTGLDKNDGPLSYNPLNDPLGASLNERVNSYLERGTANAFRVGDSDAGPGLFNDCAPLAPKRFVICDSFGKRRITVGDKTVGAGTPILYYKANSSSKTLAGRWDERIYNVIDNMNLVNLRSLTTDGRPGEEHPLQFDDHHNLNLDIFYEYIGDPKATAASGVNWPHRPDSYILISAGADGLYGTSDDIRNFGD